MEGNVMVPIQSLTVEQERDSYREKVEHFKVLLRKLQEENQSLKIRKEGTETVSKLLQESKQECCALKKKQSTYEAVIRNLQSRLESNGLSSDIVLQEGETYIPGHSRRLLDNLTRENNRLRHIVRSKSGDPEEFARLQQCNEDLENERTRLLTRIAELDQILKSSDNEKDQVVKGLREQVEYTQRELVARDNLVRTLSEESRVLQKQLLDVAQQCQELARKLNEQGTSAEKVTKETLQKNAPETADDAILQENKALQCKVEEITQMNIRWQKYNAQREKTVNKLVQEIKQLQKRVQDSERTGGNIAHETQVEMNRILDESRRIGKDLENQKHHVTRLTGERDRYKRDLDNAHGQIKALKQEVQQLKASRGGNLGVNIPVDGDSTEVINALKAQIQICTEDFESERRDRERAQAMKMCLEAENEKLKKEMDGYRRALHQVSVAQSPHNDPAYHFQGHPLHGSVERLAARGVPQQRDLDKYNVIDGSEQTPVVPMEPVPDTRKVDNNAGFASLNAFSISSYSKDSESSRERLSPKPDTAPPTGDETAVVELPDNNSSGKPRDSETKYCPKCNKAYTSEQLVEHFEDCFD